MNDQDMGDGGIGGQLGGQGRGVRRHVLGGFGNLERAAGVFQDLAHALAVGAVDQDQRLAGLGDQGAERRLDHEGAGTLQRHADVGRGRIGDFQQLTAHGGVGVDERLIARAPIVAHGVAGFGGGGQGAGREKKGITGGQRHGWAFPTLSLGPRPGRSGSRSRGVSGGMGQFVKSLIRISSIDQSYEVARAGFAAQRFRHAWVRERIPRVSPACTSRTAAAVPTIIMPMAAAGATSPASSMLRIATDARAVSGE